MLRMRTTVTLDDDTVVLLKERMLRQGVSFKQALNDAVRESARDEPRAVVTTPVRDMGVPALDLTKALRMAGELEDEHLISSLRRGS